MREHGLRATERLLFDLTCPSDLKQLASRNSFFYLRQFPIKEKRDLVFELPAIRSTSHRFRPSSSSIVRVPTGYRMICRTVNYICDRAMRYESLAHDQKIRTKNFFISLSPDLKVIRAQELVDATGRTYLTGIEGFEDCR